MAQLPATFKDGPAPTDLTETELAELWHDCSDLQQAWVLEYMDNGFNATQAAKDAGYQASTEQAFRRIGSDNKNHPRLRKLRQALMERHMTADEALSRLAEIARGDMQDFLSVEDGHPVFDYEKAKKRGALHLIKEIDLERNEDPETGEITTEAKVKLYDKQKALTSILDVLGAGDDEADDDPTVQLNQQINNYLSGSGDTPFDDVDNQV